MSAVIKLSSPATKEFWEIPILFEDGHLLALDKPASLLVSPDPLNPERPCLMTLLHDAIAAGKPWAAERNISYLVNAHRLDAEASGVLLLAKSKPILVALTDVFGAENTGRKYAALVRGRPQAGPFVVNAKLGPHPMYPELICVDPRNGKQSKTRFEVVEIFSGYALMDCEPFPDRPHQIRAHLHNSGLPVCGDAHYGGTPLLLSKLKDDYRLKPGRTELPLISRAALHTKEQVLVHPISGEKITITAPLPKDLRVALKYLRHYAGQAGS